MGRDEKFSVSNMLDDVAQLAKRRLSAKGRTSEARLLHARKRLPRRLKGEADTLLAAARQARYRPDLPLLATGKLEAARDALVGHMKDTDYRERRRVARRSWVADFVINMAILLVLLVAFRYVATAL